MATFVLQLAFCTAVVVLIARARKGLRIPPIRKVAGLDALDEAIGRATEMGATVHFSPGIGAVDNAQTLAALSIMGYVAKTCAKYDTRFIQTNRNNIVYSVAEEVIKQAYAEAGKLDSFNADDVRFISEDQFGYASGVVGIMHREKVRANILIGCLIGQDWGKMAGALLVVAGAVFATLNNPWLRTMLSR